MAVTKTHPIKSTVNLAIEYICSPEKTDGKILVSSYECSPETADIEFEITRDKAFSSRGTILARHLIQSFAPGETTPEQAHEIGKRLADEALKGKYEYVLSTHIDKGHIHNHIIFNAVSFTDYKKYHSNKRSYHEIQRVSDNLCKEYGLSIIEPSGNKGKSYIEHSAEKSGTSWKAQLRLAVDKNIIAARSFEEFLHLMELDGYKVKRQNKNVSFCTDERGRYMRSKTLGDNYTVDKIIDRIAGRAVKSILKQDDKRIHRIIDLENNNKGKGFEHWSKINNLKQSAKTLNFLNQHNIGTYEELKIAADNAAQKFQDISSQIKIIEKEINHNALLIKHIQTYIKLKPIYMEYKKAENKADFREQHRELALYESAYNKLKAVNFPKIKEIQNSNSELTEKKKLLYQEYREARSVMVELDTVKSNIENLIYIDKSVEHDKNNTLE